MTIAARARSLVAGRFRALRPAAQPTQGDDAVERSLVWMLGSPRTGSTWLLNLLAIDQRVVRSDEPGIGIHLGVFAADVMGAHPTEFDNAGLVLWRTRFDDREYFFNRQHEDVWRPHLRALVLSRLGALVDERNLLVIKEPMGSQVADLLLRIVPRSRLLFLLRDGRDVVDSELDAVGKGGWLAEHFSSTADITAEERRRLAAGLAHRWVVCTEAVQRAYDQHDPELRLLVRYEDLLADTPAVLERILRWMGSTVPATTIAEQAARLSFSALPSDLKGSGRFARAATPGLWRENLTADEQAAVHEVMAPTLRAMGYDVDG